MNYRDIQIKQRIYYTGDMKNHEGEGTITRIINDEWGMGYDIIMDDGRLWRKVSPLSFEDGPGRRFWPLDEYNKDSISRILKSQARMREILSP